jgi:hypothetical protein
VGRIETTGETLVDLEETISLLNKSRITVFRLIRRGELVKINVGGANRLFITEDSIKRVIAKYGKKKRLDKPATKNMVKLAFDPNNCTKEEIELRRAALRKHHPDIFPS